MNQPRIALDPLRDALATAFDAGRLMLGKGIGSDIDSPCLSAFIDLQRTLATWRTRLHRLQNPKKRPVDQRTLDVIRGLARLNECALVQIRGGLSEPGALGAAEVDRSVGTASYQTSLDPQPDKRMPTLLALARTATIRGYAPLSMPEVDVARRVRVRLALGAVCAWLVAFMATMLLSIASS
jgi:hypothetical protein